MNPLRKLIDCGQSYWLDNLTRAMIENGELARRVKEEGLRGVTSNPAIFKKAIAGSHDYDRQIQDSARKGMAVEAIYEELVVSDIKAACDVLRPVYDSSQGGDGFVSLEVSPHLAHDAEGTMVEARRLWSAVGRPNLLIKIPGSPAGVPAIEEMLFEGINVNVTLLFAIEAYEAVAVAYLRALERRAAEGRELKSIASVASFFLSRIDTLADEKLAQAKPGEGVEPRALKAKLAIANAKLAYQSYKRLISTPRWAGLKARGAKVQRLLWASTSTKNPDLADTYYVEPLIGRDTVNTLPDQTIAAFADHGKVECDTVEKGIGEAERVLTDLKTLGLSLEAITDQLLEEGVQKFIDPFDDLLKALEEKMGQGG